MAEALIALGGNVGDVRSTFEQAIAKLCSDDFVRLTARSADYRTPPWGMTKQAPFVNVSHRRDHVAGAARPPGARARMRASRSWDATARSSAAGTANHPTSILLAYDDPGAHRDPDESWPGIRTCLNGPSVLLPFGWRLRPIGLIAGVQGRGRARLAWDASGHRQAPARRGTALYPSFYSGLALSGPAWHFAAMTDPELYCSPPIFRPLHGQEWAQARRCGAQGRAV